MGIIFMDDRDADKWSSEDQDGNQLKEKYYEIPKNNSTYKHSIVRVYFNDETREIVFTGLIIGKIKDPGGFDNLFEESATVELVIP